MKALLDKGVDVIACDLICDDIDKRAERRTLNLFELPEGNVWEQLGSPDVCLHMAWRNGLVHNAPTQMGDVSSHYKFLTAMIDGGLKQLAVMGTMHEVGYWEGSQTVPTILRMNMATQQRLIKFLITQNNESIFKSYRSY